MSTFISSASSTQLLNSTTTIEDLPEPILADILSLLYIQDAIRTSLVSRKFQNLWHLVPSLHFDLSEYYSRSTSTNPRTHVSRQQFAESVEHTLIVREPYPLTKFALTFEYTVFDNESNPKHQYYVQNWIRYAIGLSVSELVLEFNHSKFDLWNNVDSDTDEEWGFTSFHFHFLDIHESCIKLLKLSHCCLHLPSVSNPIKFLSLKSLEIGDELWISGEDVSNLLERCVNLETLKLVALRFDNRTHGLRIYSASLKELYLVFLNYGISLDLDICCPSLQKISMIDIDIGNYIIKDTTLLLEAYIYFIAEDDTKQWEKILSCFSNISTLPVWHELLESNEVPPGCEQFASNLKHLNLSCDFNKDFLVGVAALLKLLPNLEMLELYNSGTGDENLQNDNSWDSTVFSMPCIKKVILKNYKNTKNDSDITKLFTRCGTVLERLDLFFL